MGGDPTRRLILRAELARGGRSVVAHTIELGGSSLFVRTDEPAYIGERLTVKLSFPGLMQPLALEAHVVSKRFASGPGEGAGLTLGFLFHSAKEEERYAELIHHDDPVALATGSFQILVVEDNAMMRDIFAVSVKKCFQTTAEKGKSNVKVDLVGDGAQAYSMLTAGSYDLAVIDYFLPSMDGALLVQQIRADARLASLPVIAVSVGGDDAREAVLGAGADFFLDKPLVIGDLFSTLRRLIASRPA
jgi:CheY-like chemotaxis protein